MAYANKSFRQNTSTLFDTNGMLWRCTRLGALSLHVFPMACGRASSECMEDNALFFRACEMASATGEGARANRGRAAHAPRKTNMMKSKEEQAELHKAI